MINVSEVGGEAIVIRKIENTVKPALDVASGQKVVRAIMKQPLNEEKSSRVSRKALLANVRGFDTLQHDA